MTKNTEHEFTKILTNKSIMKVLKTYTMKNITLRTGIPQSTLKNYKYKRLPIKTMPLYIVTKLSDMVRYDINETKKQKKSNK